MGIGNTGEARGRSASYSSPVNNFDMGSVVSPGLESRANGGTEIRTEEKPKAMLRPFDMLSNEQEKK